MLYKEATEGEDGGKVASRHVEARNHHAIHGEVLQIESSWSARGCLPIRLREVAIGIGIGAGRRDMGGVKHIGVDEFELHRSVGAWARNGLTYIIFETL